MEVLKKIETSLKKQLPFVAYKKPSSTTISGLFQQNDELYYTKEFVESGFVFAPFDNERPSVLIPRGVSELVKETINFNEEVFKKTSFSSDETVERQYIFIVEKAIKAIENKEFKKVVLSRRETMDADELNVVEIFVRMVCLYTSAMVYVWFHPKVGLWLGATPETLLKITQKRFETMSLAGTQVYKGSTSVTWQPKEIDEQQVVTDYICANLQSISSNITVCDAKTVKAGSLLHLQTKILGELTSSISELILVLHPTPAVCGYPKDKAEQFIVDNEGYNRSFYTGFFGELQMKGSSELYVNLRCMQIENNQALIYVGGGITLQSNAKKEWNETVAKAEIMKQVFLVKNKL